MRVLVKVPMDIDPEEWDLNYGTGTDPKAVRADVQKWASSVLHDAANESGVLR